MPSLKSWYLDIDYATKDKKLTDQRTPEMKTERLINTIGSFNSYTSSNWPGVLMITYMSSGNALGISALLFYTSRMVLLIYNEKNLMSVF